MIGLASLSLIDGQNGCGNWESVAGLAITQTTSQSRGADVSPFAAAPGTHSPGADA